MNSLRSLILMVMALIATVWLITGCTEDKSPVAPEPEPQPTVDHVAPTVEWVEPQGGADLSGTVELAFTAVDSGTVERVRIYRSGFVLGEGGHSCLPENRNISATDDTLYTLEWDTRTVGDDVYILEARAWDEAGNLGVSPSLLVRVKNDSAPPPEDRTPPLVVWRSPQPGSEIAGTVELRFDALDNVGIDSLKVYLNGSCPEGFEMTGHPEAEYSVTWVTDSLSDGSYIIEVRAWDSSGNEGGCPSLLLRVKNSSGPDRTPPDVWWTAPDAGSTLTDSVLLQFRAFDEGTVTYVQLYRNGTSPEGARLPGRPDNEYDFWWNTLNDSDGVHVWEARAWDEAGNMGVSPSLLVRVRNNEEPPPEDHTPPVVTWLSPEPGSEVMGMVTLRFQVMDDVSLDSVTVYLNGRIFENFQNMGNFFDGYVTWITSDYPDGNYIVEVRAWDSSGNMGVGVGVVLTVRNDIPHVIWVPDDYEKIQDAINASEDGDTVRVRAGTYREGLRLMGKNICLESERGPEVTTIDGHGWDEAIMIKDGEGFRTSIRGFTFRGNWTGIHLKPPSQVNIYNCVFYSINEEESATGVWIGSSNSRVFNCVFDLCDFGLEVDYSWGKLRNSIFVRCNYGIYERAAFICPLDYGWDLFWDNTMDYWGLDYRESDIQSNPNFVQGSYQLNKNSPAIDSGDPSIVDIDGSRSDIGVYGGPYAYPINN